MTLYGQIVVIILLAGFLFPGIEVSCPVAKIETDGYTAVTAYKNGFVATGTQGRIDRITMSGKVSKSETFPGENFYSVVADDRKVVAAGEGGTIIISDDGVLYRKYASGTSRNIRSLVLFNTKIIGGADNGEIILEEAPGRFRVIRLPLKGDIMSLSSRDTDCYGVTSEGEIIHSRDGLKWDIIDFNKIYAGYYKACSFTCLCITEDRIAVAGVNNDGSPAVYFSTQGNVWTERPLIYTDDTGVKGDLSDKPWYITYVGSVDEFYIACSNGNILRLPGCTQCNRLSSVSEYDIRGIAQVEDTIIFVGEGYFIKTI